MTVTVTAQREDEGGQMKDLSSIVSTKIAVAGKDSVSKNPVKADSQWNFAFLLHPCQ